MLRVQAGFQLSGALVLVLLLAVARGMAGEAIIVGKEGSKTDAIKESKFGKELSRPWEKVSPDSPLNGFFPSLPRMNPIDPKADRKRKLDDREKKNWMTVLPGELQSEEEKKNFLGVREYEIEKEEDTDNLMFREMRAEKNGSQTTAKTRTALQRKRTTSRMPRRGRIPAISSVNWPVTGRPARTMPGWNPNTARIPQVN